MLDVDATSVSGTWWRHIPAGGDVLYQPDVPADNRWQRGSVVDALYFGDEPDTVWAEWYRAIAELGVAPRALLPRDLWEWTVHIGQVANLGDEQRLARVGLSRPVPGRAGWPPYQRVGEQLYREGYRGVLSVSAARSANRVLCLFRDRRTVDGAKPEPPPSTIDEPPTVPRGMTT